MNQNHQLFTKTQQIQTNQYRLLPKHKSHSNLASSISQNIQKTVKFHHNHPFFQSHTYFPTLKSKQTQKKININIKQPQNTQLPPPPLEFLSEIKQTQINMITHISQAVQNYRIQKQKLNDTLAQLRNPLRRSFSPFFDKIQDKTEDENKSSKKNNLNSEAAKKIERYIVNRKYSKERQSAEEQQQIKILHEHLEKNRMAYELNVIKQVYDEYKNNSKINDQDENRKKNNVKILSLSPNQLRSIQTKKNFNYLKKGSTITKKILTTLLKTKFLQQDEENNHQQNTNNKIKKIQNIQIQQKSHKYAYNQQVANQQYLSLIPLGFRDSIGKGQLVRMARIFKGSQTREIQVKTPLRPIVKKNVNSQDKVNDGREINSHKPISPKKKLIQGKQQNNISLNHISGWQRPSSPINNSLPSQFI